MFARSFTVSAARAFVRHLFRVAAITGVAVTFTAPGHAQEAGVERKHEPVLYTFTVDVAEDLAGKFRPTFVKPEDTQPERGSFFVTGGRVFPAGTIEGDGATFDPNRSGHIGVWICRGTHLVAANEIPAAHWWVETTQLFVLGRQAKEQLTTEGLEGAERSLASSPAAPETTPAGLVNSARPFSASIRRRGQHAGHVHPASTREFVRQNPASRSRAGDGRPRHRRRPSCRQRHVGRLLPFAVAITH